MHLILNWFFITHPIGIYIGQIMQFRKNNFQKCFPIKKLIIFLVININYYDCEL